MGFHRRPVPFLAALGLVVAACGDSGAATSTTATPSTTTTVPATAVTTATTLPVTEPPETTGPPETTEPPEGTTTTAIPPGWSQQEPSPGPLPSGRQNSVLVVDPESQALYLHGGRTEGQALTDLWRYDLDGGAWTEVVPENSPPAARYAHTGVWDEARSRLVIFSGQGGPGLFFSDVWAWEAATNQWTQLAPDNAGPLNRYGSCAGYDLPQDRFLISHGFTDEGRFDDTWAFDLGANDWTDISPQGPRPFKRCLHACSYDPASEAFLLFGGQSNDALAHGDAWLLEQREWTEVSSTGPEARRFTTTVAAGGSWLLFGGAGLDGELADLWSLGAEERSWESVDAGEGPAARHSHAAALDPWSGRVWVFGGRGAEGELNDLWLLEGLG